MSLVPYGSRPLHKILDGDDAPNWVHFALKQLEILRRTSGPQEPRSKHLKFDTVDIMVEKNVSWDRITIRTGGFDWVAIGEDSFYFGANVTKSQLAKAAGPGGPWTERPADIHEPADENIASDGKVLDAFAVILQTRQQTASTMPIMALGDGRTSFAFYADGITAAYRFQVVMKANGKADKFLLIAAPQGRLDSFNFCTEFYGSVAYDIQPIWAKNPDLNDRITLQFSVWSLHRKTEEIAGDTFEYFQHRYSRFDVDHGARKESDLYTEFLHGSLPGDAQSNTPLVDNFSIPWGPGRGSGNFVWPDYIHLTPERMLASRFFTAVNALDAFVQKAEAVSLNGGRTWDYYPTSDPLSGPIYPTGERNNRVRYAALNGHSALRLSFKYNGDTYNFSVVVERVDTLNASLLLKDLTLDADVSFGAIGNGNAGDLRYASFLYHDIFALGRNCYCVRLIYRYVLAQEERTVVGNDGVTIETILVDTLWTYRMKSTRSYDGGVTWDQLVDSGFDTNQATGFGIVDRNGNQTETRYLDSFYPYAHKSFNGREDKGVVYNIIRLLEPYTRSDSANPRPLTHTRAMLYKSTDQMKTWQYLVDIAHKHASETYAIIPNSDRVRFLYWNLVDKNAAIDPIFPWRVDARYTPPDWW